MQCIKALKLLHKVLDINVLQRINVKLTILTNTFSREAFSLSTPLMSEARRKLGCDINISTTRRCLVHEGRSALSSWATAT